MNLPREEVEEWRETIPYNVRHMFSRDLNATKFLDESKARGNNRLWDLKEYFWNYYTDLLLLARETIEE